MRGSPFKRLSLVFLATAASATISAQPTTFVLTSDVHYGYIRGKFRDGVNVPSRIVNAAAVEKINALPQLKLPEDGGLRAGEAVGAMDFVIITGDLTSRQELYPIRIQSATESWREFEAGYLRGISLRNREGGPTPVLMVPGNHDVGNALGAPTQLVPATDATALVEIYNRMMAPVPPRTVTTYRYATDRILYSRNIGGAHCVFLTVWPDSVARDWMERDLARVPASTPVFLFCHDPPEGEAKHFVNPNGKHDINREDKFENILADVYAGGAAITGPTTVEQRALARFLKAHRNIVAYFHGHKNFSQFYTWTGPDRDLELHVFRADSPIRGEVSGKDETKLAFAVVTYDVAQSKLTAREFLWNRAASASAWGDTKSVTIAPH